MTKYAPEEMQGWEFKILRAENMGGFKNPETLKKVLAEEAMAGWVFLEKFDDYRLRFKRPAGSKVENSVSGIDPYRATVGSKLPYVVLALLIALLTLSLSFFMLRRP